MASLLPHPDHRIMVQRKVPRHDHRLPYLDPFGNRHQLIVFVADGDVLPLGAAARGVVGEDESAAGAFHDGGFG